MTIEQFIIDLLKQHNCVVVPNFGGFIANYQPAIIDSVSKTITPPSKQVLFNANLLKNDGLLANYVAHQKAISYPESLVEIENKAVEWKQSLANDKRLAFGEIGFLYEQNGVIVFEQNRDTNLWLKAYGLSSIQFIAAKDVVAEKQTEQAALTSVSQQVSKPIDTVSDQKTTPIIALSQNEKIEVIPEAGEQTKVIPLENEKKSRKKWGYIAAACALPFLFYTYWIPMETNFLETGNIQISDFNPFNQNKVVSVYQQRSTGVEIEDSELVETFEQQVENLTADVEVYQYQFDEALYIPVKLDLKSDQIEMTPDSKTESVSAIYSNAKEAPIQLIAGCFSVEDNAINLVSDLKSTGYAAYILDKRKGLYRVAVKGFQNMTDAKAAKADLKAKSYSSWILRK